MANMFTPNEYIVVRKQAYIYYECILCARVNLFLLFIYACSCLYTMSVRVHSSCICV